MTGPEFNNTDACKHDRQLLQKTGILSFTAEPESAEDTRAFAIVDFALDNLLHEAQASLAG